MWTPKRVLLLASGLAVFVAAYLGYAFFLGGIDGLPALPSEFWPRETGTIDLTQLPMQEIDRKLVQAFGDGCPELGRSFKVETFEKAVRILNTPKKGVQLDQDRLTLFEEMTEKLKSMKTGIDQEDVRTWK